MRKILKIAEPIADAYVHMGMEFAIFLSDEKYYPWIINNYIQIYALKDMYRVPERGGTLTFFHGRYADWQMFEMSANPYLNSEKISFNTMDFLLKSSSLVDLLKTAIDNEKYIFIPIDMYSLSMYSCYQQRHRVHHIFIVGYDEENRCFLGYDNFLEGKYQIANIPFTDLVDSYLLLASNEATSSWSETNGTCFYSFHQTAWHKDKFLLYSVNIDTIKNELREYLMLPGYASSYRNITHYAYGIDCYDELEKILDYGMASEQHFTDHRSFASMRDHKKVMLFRLKYLQEKYNINLSDYIDAYSKIKCSFDSLIHQIIKTNITKHTSTLNACKQLLAQAKSLEISTLTQLLDDPMFC